MARHTWWIPITLAFAAAALVQPWRGEQAEARPTPACGGGEVAKLRAQLATTQAALVAAQSELATARAHLAQILDLERQRAKRLADQLGSPLIEELKGGAPLK